MRNDCRASLQNLVNRLGTKLHTGLVRVHQQPIRTALQQRLDLALAQLRRRLRTLVVLVHVLEDGTVEPKLHPGAIKHVTLVGVARQQPVHLDRLLLSDAVAACLRLQVVLRVPITVKNHHRVRGRQVDAHAAGSRAQQKDKGVAARVAEPVNRRLPQLALDRAVDALGAGAHAT